MRVLIQRVSQASVTVESQCIASIERGIVALVGFGSQDSLDKLDPALDKILQLRIFPNDLGRFDRSLEDIQGGLLLVPQFTLYADTSKGRRPEFFAALHPTQSSPLFSELLVRAQRRLGSRVSGGIFGADMKVALVNDGPVTISIEI